MPQPTKPGETPVHLPVMLQEAMRLLAPKPGATIVDATVGAAGHAAHIADAIGKEGRLVAIDRDPYILPYARSNLARFSGRLDLVQDNFENPGEILKKLNVSAVDGILFDLGVSSLQLESGERGFSFMKDGPLDMRMNPEMAHPAEKAINQLPEKRLIEILQTYGEERFARRIARAIVRARKRARIATTSNLVNIIRAVVPPARRGYRIHPATRTFLALRIYVNRELECLEHALENIEDVMNPGARLVVIAFHSLEDRIVKNSLRRKAEAGTLKLIFKKPLRPSDDETRDNPRSRSAKLRAAERL
ncbi:MAG: 16S rRNA (cytosine(1402)-N(4))-methyltransferase RsmH [Planctomycetota bacterium]